MVTGQQILLLTKVKGYGKQDTTSIGGTFSLVA